MQNNAQKKIRPDFLILASLIDFVFGIIGLIISILLLPSLASIADGSFVFGHMDFSSDFMSLMMSIMIIGLLLVSIPLILSGIALYLGYGWAKLIHTISWIPALIMFPIGTLLGIFSIWIVQTREVTKFFNNDSSITS